MIDIGTLSAVFAMVGPDEADRGHGGDFFRHYFTEELIRNCPLPHGSDPLAQASEYTYEYSISRTTPDTEEQGSAEWQVVHHGADRQTFLVAKRACSRPRSGDLRPPGSMPIRQIGAFDRASRTPRRSQCLQRTTSEGGGRRYQCVRQPEQSSVRIGAARCPGRRLAPVARRYRVRRRACRRTSRNHSARHIR